ncbi:MAG: FAD binding domain-containing protein [Pseudomonadota bacterium]
MATDYLLAGSLDEASEALSTEATSLALAGGQSLLPAIRAGRREAGLLVDVGALQELKGIQADAQKIVIGATETHFSIANSPLLLELCPVCCRVAGAIGDAQVRHRGTIGGSVAENLQSSDWVVLLAGLGATIVSNERRLGIEKLLEPRARSNSEIFRYLEMRRPEAASYRKLPNRASGHAIAGVFTALVDGDLRIAVTGLEDSPRRLYDLESQLELSTEFDDPKTLQIEPENCIEDRYASGEYRAAMIQRLLMQSLSDLRSQL